jgi:hypothetical protein
MQESNLAKWGRIKSFLTGPTFLCAFKRTFLPPDLAKLSGALKVLLPIGLEVALIDQILF